MVCFHLNFIIHIEIQVKLISKNLSLCFCLSYIVFNISKAMLVSFFEPFLKLLKLVIDLKGLLSPTK